VASAEVDAPQLLGYTVKSLPQVPNLREAQGLMMSLTQQQRDEIAAYLARSEGDLLEEASLYVPTPRGDPLAPYIARLKRAICDDWNWCERRQDARFEDSLNAAFAVCDLLLSKQF